MRQTTRISKPKVLKSAAGYYIGTTQMTLEDHICVDEQPYERLSGYYPSQESAEEDLHYYQGVL